MIGRDRGVAKRVLTEVDTGSLDLERLVALLDRAQAERVRDAALRARAELADRAVINVNSTARGGGVAEMLLPLVAYARGTGIDCRWLVITGTPDFFRVTKRIHNRLHGAEGDGGPLGPEEREAYESALSDSGEALLERIGPRDVVILHDPQTAGLVPRVADAGNPVIWRCHVGIDDPNDLARSVWQFLAPYIKRADRVVFSRTRFAWDVVEPSRRAIIAPSIDALAPKNQNLPDGGAAAILAAAGLRMDAGRAAPEYDRLDGTRATVRSRAELDGGAPLRPDDRYVLQVSRWDRLKDPHGVVDGFVDHVAPWTDAHLLYAGPDVLAVNDDPEGGEVLQAARERRRTLPEEIRARVHLAMLPMQDIQENAAIVNALQRCATVVVQKSLAEGFGLTVAEAMWKSRPVVASRIGGISDQIEHDRSGLLLDDPRDLAAYGASVLELLRDPDRAAALGAAARERVRQNFLGTHSLVDYMALIDPLIGRRADEAAG
jgi:trehalose synthase